MKLNVWKIQELPRTVFKVAINKNKSVQTKLYHNSINGFVIHRGIAHVIGKEEYVAKNFKYTTGSFNDLPNENQIKLLYHILDDTFHNIGFKLLKKQRIFYLPKSKSNLLLRQSNDGSLFINIGFKFNITTLNKRLLILFNPLQIVTSDGNNFQSSFANKMNPKVLEDNNLKPRYNYLCKILDSLIDFFGSKGEFSFEYGNCGRIKFSGTNDIEITVFKEPEIDFGNGNYHTWAKNGLVKFHPLDYNEGHQKKTDSIKLSLIGTKQSFNFLSILNKGESNVKYPFKGFKEVYKTQLVMGRERYIELSSLEIDNVSGISDIITLIMSKIASLKNQRVDFDICLVELVPNWESFFSNQSKDLHDLLKVEAWKNRVVTQIYTKRTNENVDSDKLNNISLGIYYKAGGNPWRLKTDFNSTAYVGISFGYSELDKKRLVGVAEIFDNYGQFISLRSVTIKEVNLDKRIEEKRDIHLSTDQLSMIIKALLEDYNNSLDGNFPDNLIIHKTTYFNKNEKAILKELSAYPINFSFVHIQKEHNWKLITGNKMEPLRGTFFRINNSKAMLYTSGLLSNQNKYFLPGSPKPYIINLESESNFTIKQICLQILELTKLNFNSTNTYSKEPVTLLHSRDIIDLLRVGLDPMQIPHDPRYFL